MVIHLRVQFEDGCQVDIMDRGYAHVPDTPPLFYADEKKKEEIEHWQKVMREQGFDFPKLGW